MTLSVASNSTVNLRKFHTFTDLHKVSFVISTVAQTKQNQEMGNCHTVGPNEALVVSGNVFKILIVYFKQHKFASFVYVV